VTANCTTTVTKVSEITEEPSRVLVRLIPGVRLNLPFRVTPLRNILCPTKSFTPEIQAFLCASDAAFADNVYRKSTEVKLFGAGVPRNKKLLLTTSTTHYKRVLLVEEDFGLDLEEEGSTPILCNNQQTVGLLQKEQPVLVANHWGKPDTWNPLTT
jgi:hypothetical protein